MKTESESKYQFGKEEFKQFMEWVQEINVKIAQIKLWQDTHKEKIDDINTANVGERKESKLKAINPNIVLCPIIFFILKNIIAYIFFNFF